MDWFTEQQPDYNESQSHRQIRVVPRMTDLLRIVDWKTSQSHRTDQGSSRKDIHRVMALQQPLLQSHRTDQGSSKGKRVSRGRPEIVSSQSHRTGQGSSKSVVTRAVHRVSQGLEAVS